MTAKEFIAWVQGYYGMYPDGQKKDIAEYLTSKSPKFLDALKKVLLLRYPSKWGRPPDIAIFTENEGEALDLIKYNHPQIEENEELVSPEKFKALQELFSKIDQKMKEVKYGSTR